MAELGRMVTGQLCGSIFDFSGNDNVCVDSVVTSNSAASLQRELQMRLTRLPYAVLSIMNSLLDISDRPRSPTALVMLRPLQLRSSGPQVVERPFHMRLIRLGRSETQ